MKIRAIVASIVAEPLIEKKLTPQQEVLEESDIKWCFDQADRFIAANGQTSNNKVNDGDTWLVSIEGTSNLVSLTINSSTDTTVNMGGALQDIAALDYPWSNVELVSKQ